MGMIVRCPACGGEYAGPGCPNCPTQLASAPEFKPGDTFHGLEILGLLGRGGMGAVYRARQTALDREVAVKVIVDKSSTDAGWIERFTREAKALASVAHPNIVHVYDFGREGERFFLVMELVEGRSLRGRRADSREAVRLIGQLLDGLEVLHRRGIVHRDIKPDNLLVGADGRLRIADFGLAKLVAMDELTRSGDMLGTYRYMAPEQMASAARVDFRADLYSAGVVLYELLTGALPSGSFEPPSRKGADPRFDAIVMKALSQDPEQRHPSAEAMKRLLDAAISEAPAGPKSGRPWRAFAAGIVATAAAVVLLAWPKPKAKPEARRPAPVPLERLDFQEGEDPAGQPPVSVSKAHTTEECEKFAKSMRDELDMPVRPGDMREAVAYFWRTTGFAAWRGPRAAENEEALRAYRRYHDHWVYRADDLVVIAWVRFPDARPAFEELLRSLRSRLAIP